MFKFFSLLSVFAGLLLSISSVAAAPTNKCVVSGIITYQQTPCSSGATRDRPTVAELNAAERKRSAAPPVMLPGNQPSVPASSASSAFSCDGRKYCSQMRSCGEAKYFLANCSGVKMDGDGDGIPCEEQWCQQPLR